MSLYTVANGNTINAADINQFVTILAHGIRQVVTAAQTVDNSGTLTSTTMAAYPNLSIPSITTAAGSNILVLFTGSFVTVTAATTNNIGFQITGLTSGAFNLAGTSSAYTYAGSLAVLVPVASANLNAGAGGTFSPVLNYQVSGNAMSCRASTQSFYEGCRIALFEYV